MSECAASLAEVARHHVGFAWMAFSVLCGSSLVKTEYSELVAKPVVPTWSSSFGTYGTVKRQSARETVPTPCKIGLTLKLVPLCVPSSVSVAAGAARVRSSAARVWRQVEHDADQVSPRPGARRSFSGEDSLAWHSGHRRNGRMSHWNTAPLPSATLWLLTNAPRSRDVRVVLKLAVLVLSPITVETISAAQKIGDT